MRIGMLVDRYKPYISGVTNCVSLNKQYLEKLGHQVYVFTFGDEDYMDEEINVIRSHGLPIVDTGFSFNLNFSKQARKLMSTLDIVHVHHPFLSGSLALHFFRPRGIPIVFTNHTRYDLYAHAYLPMLPESVGETAIRAFLPYFCRRIDLVIAPTQGMATILQGFGVDVAIQVIPNGVDLKPFKNPAEPFNRSAFGIPPEDVILIYVGRLGPEKNVAFLLRSFIGIAKGQENVHLIIVGEGTERDNLEDRALQSGVGNKIHFTGFIPYSMIPNYLSMADVFVTASVTEVHPLTVIEALARGLPVLGIDSPGIGDLISNGENGLLSSNDIAEFTALLMRLVSDPELRAKMGENASKNAHNYDINRSIALTIDQYNLLVNQYKSWQKNLRARILSVLDR